MNLAYLRQGNLRVDPIGRGVAWLDAGTHESLLQASNFIQALQDRQGMMVSCPEEIAYRRGFIDRTQLLQLTSAMKRDNPYDDYLLRLAEE